MARRPQTSFPLSPAFVFLWDPSGYRVQDLFLAPVAGSSGEGWKGEADVAILFCFSGSSRGAGGRPFAAPFLEVRIGRDAAY